MSGLMESQQVGLKQRVGIKEGASIEARFVPKSAAVKKGRRCAVQALPS